MRYIIYGRVSTGSQQGNTSLPLQEDAGVAFGNEREWQHVRTVTDDGVSGIALDRPGVKQLLAALQNREADTVVFAKVDRAGRDVGVLDSLFTSIYAAGAKVAIVSEARVFETLSDLKRSTVFLQAMSAYEHLSIRERIVSGRLAHVKRGSFMSRPIYGYQFVKEIRDGVRINIPVPHSGESPVVVRIIDEFLAGTSRTAIVHDLNQDGIPTRRHRGMWHIGTATDILSRANLYAGETFTREITVGGVKYPVTYQYPAIIDPDTAQAVTRTLQIRPRKGIVTPFKGVLFCNCGGYTVGRGWTRRYGRTYYRLACHSVVVQDYYRRIGGTHDAPVCGYTISYRDIVRAVRAFIAEDGAKGMRGHVSRLRDELGEAQVAIAQLGYEREMLQADRMRLANRIITEFDSPDFASMKGVLNEQLGELDRGLNERAARQRGLEAVVSQQHRALEAIGVDFNQGGWREGKFVIRLDGGFYSHIQSQLKQLDRAIVGENWGDANRLMHTLGIRITADFSLTDAKKRKQTLAVSVRLPTTPETDTTPEHPPLSNVSA